MSKETAATFLRAMFGERPDGRLTVVRFKDDGGAHTSWPATSSQAAGRAAEWAPRWDTYFGCGLRRERLPGARRGGSADVGSVTAIWAELDFGTVGHNSDKLPPTEADAQRLLEEFGLPASAVVRSGGGLHVYWFLTGPVPGADGEPVLRNVGAALAAIGAAYGWHVDTVSDPARVLRVPGTFNHKTGEPRPVQLLELDSDRRYDLAAVDAAARAALAAYATVKPVPEVSEASQDGARPGERRTEAHAPNGKANPAAEAYAASALALESAELAGVRSTGRNNALNAAAMALATLASAYDAAGLTCYTDGEVWGRLWAACHDNELAADDGERRCRATFESGWRSGWASPRQLPDFTAKYQRAHGAGSQAGPVDDAGEDDAGLDTDKTDDGKAGDGKAPKPSQATMLVDLVMELGAELFHAADGEAFVTVDADGRRATMRLGSKAFTGWARYQYRDHTGRVPTGQTIADACGALAGIAEFEGPELPAHVRVAGHDGGIYLDLGGDDWHVIEVTAGGWRVLSDPPVRFYRPPGLVEMPEPLRGGSVGELWQFVNVAPEARPLVLAWLVAALRPTGPYPVLVLGGEQGSGKSTVTRALRGLIDANAVPIRAEPREGRDLLIAATSAWLVALDNLSHVQPWLSDALCRLATGGGWALRANYSDRDEVLFEATRPVILNGIGELATRSDLLDRSLVVALPTIDAVRRGTEAELWQRFGERQPYIMGALLDAVSSALAALPSVRLDTRPRMADFATWATAAESGLGLAPGDFMKSYDANRGEANALALEGSPIVEPLRDVLRACDGCKFTGTAAELLKGLNDKREPGRPPHGWPESPRGLTSILTRLAPNLRADGVAYTPAKGQRRDGAVRRVLAIEVINAAASDDNIGSGGATVNTVNTVNKQSRNGDPGPGQPSTNGAQPSTNVDNRQHFGGAQKGAVDGVDGVDGCAGLLHVEPVDAGGWNETP